MQLIKHTLLLTLAASGPVYADYASDAQSAIDLLQNKWYDTNTGLWSVT